MQVWKVLVGVMAISWSLVSYQDELRRSVPNKEQLSCGGTTTCLFWRSGMVASRVIAIATFASIIVSLSSGAVLTKPHERTKKSQLK